MVKLRQFTLLVWKNWILFRRAELWLVLEIVAPLAITILLFFLTDKVQSFDSGKDGNLVDIINETVAALKVDNCNTTIGVAYDVNVTYVDQRFEVLSILAKRLYPTTIQFRRFVNKKTLLKALTRQNTTREGSCKSFSGGIYFDVFEDTKKLDCTVLIENFDLPPLDKQFSSPDYEFTEGADSKYIKNGYVGLQVLAISSFFLFIKEGGKAVLFYPKLKPMAIPQHNTQPFLLIAYLPAILLPMIMHSVGLIVSEQFGGHRELLKIMGMKSIVYFASHFVFIWLKAFVVIFTALIFFLSRISEFVSILLLMLTGILYTINILFFIGVCVTLIPFPDAALTVSLALTIVSFIPYLILGTGPGVLRNTLLGLDFNYAFQSSIGIAVDRFQRKKNLGFGEMFEKLGIENSFGIHFAMLLIDALWMCCFMFGVDALRRNFSVESLFFWRKKKNMLDNLKLEQLAQNHEKDPHRESTPADIKLDNVVKIYKNGFLAVRKLDLSAHRDQVTCLLGHNGAGKSTAFNMITGITKETSGTVYVNKSDRIGYCPQHNVLYDDMTVWEHLWLYMKIKGATYSTKAEIERILDDLKLDEKRNVRAKKLSGGQKRKLCLGMALVGNPRVVLLDEPTAGMDVEARDFVTVFLEKHKVGRTILITTHYLDEAEELGDWIYIMFDGIVFTSGTVDFLIDRYGSGTVLRFLTATGRNPQVLASQVTQIAQQAVHTKVNSKVFEENVEVSVPNFGRFHEWHANFVRLLVALERNKYTLGFQTFGIERNSLESVFFRVGELAEHLAGKKHDVLSSDPSVDARRPRAIRPFFSFVALLAKRLIFTYNNIFIFLLHMVLPVFLIAFITYEFQSPAEGAAFTLSLLDGLKFLRSGLQTPAANSHIDRNFENRDIETFPSSDEYKNFVEHYRDHPRIGFAMADSFGIYNRFALNSLPVIVNTLADIQSNEVYGDTASVTSRVQGYTVEETNRLLEGVSLSFVMPSLLLFHLMILVNYVIAETKCKFDHLQTLTPLTKVHLWLGNFFYDFIWFIAVLAAFHIILSFADTYTGHFAIIYVISILYFVCIASFVYGLSSLFNSTTTAFAVIFITLLFVSALAILLYILVGVKNNITTPWCLLSPVFAVSGLLLLLRGSSDKIIVDDDWAYSNGGKFVLLMSLVALFYFGIFVALRSALRIWLSSKFLTYRGHEEPPLPPNEDVIAEEHRVQHAPGLKDVEQPPEADYILKVIRISKGFPGKLALRNVTFGIKRGECFGLLGASGAGKTTAFDIITGLTYATSGSVTQEKDIDNGVKIGYCPQFDAIIDCLTAYQALIILSCFNGYAHPFKKADQALELVGMRTMKHKKIRHCSGGQKRRISLAAALVASAPLTILDEPTAGVDVKCRRDLWDHLNQIRATKKATMMLTSHSMEECEALCSRIGILNKGEMVAIGSAQYLKSKYGCSFKMSIVLKHMSKRQAALDRVKATFPSAELLTKSNTSLHLYWKVDKRECERWSTIWYKGSQLSIHLDAKTFCVTQASLEEAFIHVINGAKNDVE